METLKAIAAMTCAAIIFIPIFLFQCIKVIVLGVLNIVGLLLMSSSKRK